MLELESLIEHVGELAPMLTSVAVVILLYALIRRLLLRRGPPGPDAVFRDQLTRLGLGLFVVLLAILTAPVEDGTRNQLLTVFGLIVTATITLSSTTFASNAMAGMMLRSLDSFRPGDFLEVEDIIGRVTVKGLFHTEIQTRERNLTTLPNLWLISRPYTVIQSARTVVSATVSLGYEVHNARAQELLQQAATEADLEDPFVRIVELGDYSITYRACGYLTDVKRLLHARSRLRQSILDVLHGAGVEIVSPSWVAQRRYESAHQEIPAPVIVTAAPEDADSGAQAFDIAEQAGEAEELRAEYTELGAEISELETALESARTDDERAVIERRLASRSRRRDEIQATLENQPADESQVR
jgi:small-conductance mechanosensitive channel